MIFLDTSALIRYLTGDDPHKASRVEHLLREAKSDRLELYVTHLALAEVIWVLSKVYEFEKLAVINGVRKILNTHNIFCEDAPLLFAALSLFESRPISFIDAYHAVFLPARGITDFYSCDADFDQLSGIKRREP